MSPDAPDEDVGREGPRGPHHADSETDPIFDTVVDKKAQELFDSGSRIDFNSVIRILANAGLRLPMISGFNKRNDLVITFLGGLAVLFLNIVIGLACIAWYIVAVYISHKGWSRTLVGLHEESFSFNFTTLLACCTGTGTVVAPTLLDKAAVTFRVADAKKAEAMWGSNIPQFEAIISLMSVGIIVLLDATMLITGFMVMMVKGFHFMGQASISLYGLSVIGAIGIASITYYVAKQVAVLTLYKLAVQKAATKKAILMGKARGDSEELIAFKLRVANLDQDEKKYSQAGYIALLAVLAILCVSYNFPIKWF